MAPLWEKYRPRVWSDVVGQDAAMRTVDLLRQRGLGGRAIWLNGLSGTGKTTIGLLLADEIADPLNIEELDAAQLTPKGVTDLERGYACTRLGSKRGVVILVNEAHALRTDTVKQLLTVLERIPGHVLWIFTTTLAGQLDMFGDDIDAHPLLSRCAQIKLSTEKLALAFAVRAREIAQKEGLDGKPLPEYVKLVERCKLNLREALQEIENGVMLR